jgi:cytoplasmic iron level regulating protein YaaA (DUF328/UPF0246 family)
MLLVISPAKTLDFNKSATTLLKTAPDFSKEAGLLVKRLQKLSISDLQQLMLISHDLASLNAKRFAEWKPTPFAQDTLQAVFAFRGDVYTGLQIDDFTEEELNFCQEHLRILSGLYGSLRPLDAIQPYRLEMGTAMQIGKFKNLYDFWGSKITNSISKALKEQHDGILINLASNEYFKAIKTKTLKATIITPSFKEYKDGDYRMVSFFAKKARGMMVRFIIKNHIGHADDLKHFEEDGYFYNHALSKPFEPVFTRG